MSLSLKQMIKSGFTTRQSEAILASGTSAPVSFAELENTAATPLPLAGTTVVLPLTLDSSGGTDIALDGDGQTVHLAAGVYSISAEIQVAVGHSVTGIMVLAGPFTPFQAAGGNGDGFGYYKAPLTDGALVSFSNIFRLNEASTQVFRAGCAAASIPPLSWLGVSIIRLA